MRVERYCCTCGGEYGADIQDDANRHTCPNADGDPEWCSYCGAELMETGSCDNDHSEEENPREAGDDDGVEYADPRDERDERNRDR